MVEFRIFDLAKILYIRYSYLYYIIKVPYLNIIQIIIIIQNTIRENIVIYSKHNPRKYCLGFVWQLHFFQSFNRNSMVRSHFFCETYIYDVECLWLWRPLICDVASSQPYWWLCWRMATEFPQVLIWWNNEYIWDIQDKTNIWWT